MGDVWFEVRTKDEGDRRRLMADFGPKVLTEDAIGYETLLDAEPGNARLHEAAGALRLSLGNVPRAIEHLEEARIPRRSGKRRIPVVELKACCRQRVVARRDPLHCGLRPRELLRCKRANVAGHRRTLGDDVGFPECRSACLHGVERHRGSTNDEARIERQSVFLAQRVVKGREHACHFVNGTAADSGLEEL